jgi:hypothetical protein
MMRTTDHLSGDAVLELQRMAGNAAVNALIQSNLARQAVLQRDYDGADDTTGTGGSDSVPYVFATTQGNSSGHVSLSELRKGTNRIIRGTDGDEFEFNPPYPID